MLKLTSRQTTAAWIFYILALISLYYFCKGAAEFYSFYIPMLCIIGRFVIFKPQDDEPSSTKHDSVEAKDDAEAGQNKDAMLTTEPAKEAEGVVVSLAPANEDEAIDSEGPLNVDLAVDSEVAKPEQAREEVTEAQAKKEKPKRSWYIDHLKVYSIFVVVTLHVDCALGGCGPRGWFLMTGQLQESRQFTWLLAAMMALGGSYVMPLFFGLSAVFVEGSYLKRGRKEFFEARTLRILYPALFITFLMVPGLVAFGFWFTEGHITYVPHPGHSWFLWVLLLLNWGFASLMESSKNDPPVPETTEVKKLPFPGPLKRWTYGLIFCSILPGIIFGLCSTLSGKDKVGSFMGMPFTFGGTTAYPFMFYVGYLAKKNGWVDQPMEEISGLDIRISCALITLGVAAMTYVGGDLLQGNIDGYDSKTGDFGRLIGGLIAGPYGVEACVCNIWLMQKLFNREFFFSKYFCVAAYTVFLIHPLVVTGLTALYIKLNNEFRADDQITFEVRDSCDIVTNPLEDRFYCVSHSGSGGGDYALSSHFILHWSSQIIVWPLSLMVCRLPGLRKILSF